MVFCEYPILEDEGQFAPDGSGTIELRLGGTPELFCKVRILPKGSMEFHQRFSAQTKANGTSMQPTAPRNRWFTEHQVPGNSQLRIVVSLRMRGLPLAQLLETNSGAATGDEPFGDRRHEYATAQECRLVLQNLILQLIPLRNVDCYFRPVTPLKSSALRWQVARANRPVCARYSRVLRCF